MNHLTDRTFWLNYWESKTGLVFEVPDKFPFLADLKKIATEKNAQNMLEIGGFPGYYSVWLKKNINLKATLLDYIVHQKILNDLETSNGLTKGEIGMIEADLFVYEASPAFDMVMSNGLIEHFDDTAMIIEKHINFLKNGGTAFISLPNFRGLNGWFQKIFDPENYAKHNIGCMDIDFLKKICQNLNLKNIDVRYDGGFMLWFENEAEKPLWVRWFKKIVWLPFKIFFKLVPIETKAFSPYIVIRAEKY